MSAPNTTVERAFQLAHDGSCRSIGDIRDALRRERFGSVQAHTGGPSISKQLNAELVKHKPVEKPE